MTPERLDKLKADHAQLQRNRADLLAQLQRTEAQIQNFVGAIALGEELIATETPERALLKEIAETGYLKAKVTSDETGLQERVEALITPASTSTPPPEA